jgi:lipopolysaccharide transport system permease protein
MKGKIKVYTSEASIRRPGILFIEMINDLIQSRHLAFRLAMRDFKALYRQSVLGIFWLFFLPLANTLTWIFLKNTGVIDVGSTNIPYPVYVFTGTMIWSILAESITNPIQKVLGNKSILSKINFPREALILSAFYQSLSNAGIKVLLMFLGMGLMRFDFVSVYLGLLPFGIVLIVLCGTAIGLLLTPPAMLYTDISKGLSVVLQFLMYLSPVVFPIPRSGLAKIFVGLNPFTVLIETTRFWLTGTAIMDLGGYIISCLIFIAVLFIAWLFYRISMPILIERISS